MDPRDFALLKSIVTASTLTAFMRGAKENQSGSYPKINVSDEMLKVIEKSEAEIQSILNSLRPFTPFVIDPTLETANEFRDCVRHSNPVVSSQTAPPCAPFAPREVTPPTTVEDKPSYKFIPDSPEENQLVSVGDASDEVLF